MAARASTRDAKGGSKSTRRAAKSAKSSKAAKTTKTKTKTKAKAKAAKATKAKAPKGAKTKTAKTKAAKTATNAKKANVAKIKTSAAPKKAKKDTKKKAGKKADKKADKAKKKKKKKIKGDPLLFAPLSEGERADALRILTNDRRVANMTAVGRYRIVAVEPLVVKAPSKLAKHRLARVVAYDYAADRSVHAAIDLDDVCVAHIQTGGIQPMLAREEEAAAVAIALSSDEVKARLGLGDRPQVAMHYWGVRESDISHKRRSAAVLFGQPAARPTLIAVVDLLDSAVVDVVPADQW